jgi:LL-diaminopimelate aminotransferase
VRIVFLGGGDWAPATLAALVDAGHDVAAVVPADERSADVRTVAEQRGLPVQSPGAGPLRPGPLAALDADLLVSVDYDRILKREILTTARLGGINAHPGRLPRYRGVGVVTWAVQNGEPAVGVTVHHMDEGIDSGDILVQSLVPVGPDDLNAEVIERIGEVLPGLVVDAVGRLAAGTAVRIPQDASQATYFPSRRPIDDVIDWTADGRRIHDLVRALAPPNPGARTWCGGEPVIVLRTSLRPDAVAYRGPAGQVVGHDGGLPVVKTGDSTITVVEVEEGGRVGPPRWRLATSLGTVPVLPPRTSPSRAARRMAAVKPYLFAQINEQIAEARRAGLDPISLSSGTPDLPTPAFIVDELIRASADPSTHRYPDFDGLPAFRTAVADHYGRRFGVDLDPDTEVLPLIGTKEGIAHLPWAVADPGDLIGVPDPGYPVYEVTAQLAGGTPLPLTLRAERDWFPDFDEVRTEVRRRGRPLRMFWLNYPANPTGAVTTVDRLAEAVRFAAEQDALLAYDNAYSEITFDGYVAPSVLQLPGARDVAVEFGSFSKAYNMAGWRVGWMVGNRAVVEALGRLKTNIDSGVFTAIQWAAATALQHGAAAIRDLTKVYQQRRDTLVDLFRDFGWELERPKGSLYLWLPTPAGLTSGEFTEQLLHQARVVVTPGAAYGPAGDAYVRLGLAVPDSRLEEACDRLRAALAPR